MNNSPDNNFFLKSDGVNKCKPDLSQYFHPQNISLTIKFNTIYKLFKLNDGLVAREIGNDRTTMNRYRRGIFIPTDKMKLLIAQAISKLADYQIDSAVLWGGDLFFKEWKEQKENSK